MVKMPDSDQPGCFRNSLLEAQSLFGEAGWVWRDGALRNAQGQPFVLNVQMTEGVQVRRTVADGTTTRKRMQEFDYDHHDGELPRVTQPRGRAAPQPVRPGSPLHRRDPPRTRRETRHTR
ncbi:MAG: hypothetical protein WAQ08_08350 [Aquabacterium sp.]|uniref:hypothetical protein n=1 Tax=Aquabacterium sp. TaxID=1872578 RepID=UPI003BB15B51